MKKPAGKAARPKSAPKAKAKSPRAPPPDKTAGPAPATERDEKRAKGLALGDHERDLLERLAERTSLLPREILERALAAYAQAVAPGMPLTRPIPSKSVGKGKGEEPAERLFLSVDGKPEIEISQREYVLGAAPECDLRLDLPLISPRHARVLWREGRHLFEDLHSTRGSYQYGQQVQVKFIESGDEFDLGGFLPVKFRLA